MNKREFSRLRVGTWVRVYFDDVGARDGIIIEKEADEIKVFEPTENTSFWMERDRVISVGPFIQTPRF
jgi:hypothetical protein